MADKPPTLPPASEPFPGSRTPGWNDPPTMQYNPLASSGSKRLNLNKRVAFPLQGTGGESGAAAVIKPTAVVQPNLTSFNVCLPPSMSLPPTVAGAAAGVSQPIAVVHPMPNINTTPSMSHVPLIALPSDAQEYALRVLRENAEFVEESLNVRRDEIERRIGLIEQLWQSGNLTAAVQENIYRLCQAIADHHYNNAMDTYTSLVSNHSNECGTWALALRQIVLSLQLNSAAATSESSYVGIGHVPTVFVPAMPRQVSSSDEPSATDSESNTRRESGGSVQHI